jgi:serpin B
MLAKFVITALLACTFLTAAEPKKNNQTDLKKIVRDTSEFGFSLYPLLEKSPTTNLVFSPYSIFTCMSMVYYGARGDTASEMRKALRMTTARGDLPKISSSLANSLTTQAKDAYVLETANGLWLDRDSFVLADFHHAIEQGFQAKVQSLDFSNSERATSIINEWTANQTHNKIPELLQKNDVDSSTRMVLTNAVYFKGAWQRPFDPKLTQNGTFVVDASTSVQAPMMQQTSFFSYYENDSFQLLALPFSSNDEKSMLATLILLPKKGIALQEIEKDLQTASFQSWLNALDSKQVNVKLPKFCLDKRYELNQMLKDLGMPTAFTEKANFSGINGMQDLFLNKVVHETFFALDEQGVTAAAATAASINVTAAPPGYPPVAFNVDHPFLFALVDLNSKIPLFIGKIYDPTSATCD